MHEVELILDAVVMAIFLGIAAQLLAHRLRLPAILPLLILGMVAGPQVLGLFDPHALGPVLEAFIHLGVAIILFEGSLSLDLRQIRRVGPSLRNLLTLGVAITGGGAAWLAFTFLHLPWPSAALFGAIVTVTGPTVIAPLLRHMIAPRQVRTLLLSEGLMIDPVGAVLAYLVLLWVRHPSLSLASNFEELFILCGTGTVLGFAAGSLGRLVAQHRNTGTELRNLTVLAMLVGSYAIAERQAPQSGIVAAVVMGLTMSASAIPDLAPLKAFKGQLTVLVISMLFILLSAQLDLATIQSLGWGGALVTAALVLVVRPLAVFVSVPPSQLGWRERVVLALCAPRGIVAAAVASLAAIQLREAGLAGGAAQLEGLVYLTILVTCTWSTLMALVLPRMLGYLKDPSRRRIVLVGANALSAGLAVHFQERGYQTAVIDSNPTHMDGLQNQRILTVRGDARDAATYEDAGVERDSIVAALTTNDELNLLVAELVREEIGIEHPVVALQRPPEELGHLRRRWVDLLGGHAIALGSWVRRLEAGDARFLTVPIQGDAQTLATCRSLLRQPSDQYLFVAGWAADQPSFELAVENLDRFSSLSVLVSNAPITEPLRLSAGLATETDATQPVSSPPSWAGDDDTVTFQLEVDPRALFELRTKKRAHKAAQAKQALPSTENDAEAGDEKASTEARG